VSKPVVDNPLLPDEVDSLLVSLSGHRLLVPMAAVAEIVQQVSFESLVGDERTVLGDRAMALVLYRILPDGLSQFYALQIQNFPHLIRLADDGLLQQVPLAELPPCVLMMITVREQQALIPDLDKIEQLLAEVL
jgi:hypothetical protein